MRKQLERVRNQLQEESKLHPVMSASIELLLREFDDALQPPFSKQINFIHKAQRLIKLAASKAYENKSLLKKVLAATDPSWSQMKKLPVDEQSKKTLAEQLFNSCQPRTGGKIIIASTQEGWEVAEEVIILCLKNQVDFELGIKDPLRMMYLINELDEEGLQQLTNLNLKKYEGVNREIIISSSTAPEIKKQIKQYKMDLYKKMNKEIHDRAMSGELHYTLTRIPTPADAELDDMSYDDYLNLFFELCDQPWKHIQLAQQKLVEKFDQAKEVRITNSEGTDISMSIDGQTFANSVIAKNIPGSEIFSSPLRESVNGKLVSSGKFRYGNSKLMEDITLVFENGRVMDFSARVGEKALKKIIEADDSNGEGTRHIGELGIGTNPHLRRHVVNSLLVEKIGGSFHLALGSCYTYDEYVGVPVKLKNGNQSFSGTHWDLTTMLKGKEGKMFLDGVLVQDSGDWIGEEFAVLNEGWGAVPEELRPDWYSQLDL